MLTLQSLPGTALNDYLDDIARLRIEVFRAFPYLYDGSIDYEKHYLQTYLNSAQSLIVLAWDQQRIVGASTALPLADAAPEMQQPFIRAGYALSDIFYCGESVLLPQYRGQGVGVAFFARREAHARQSGNFRFSSFCAVERPDDHPAKPADYTSLAAFWQRRGYVKQPSLVASFVWKDTDQTTESTKSLSFWLKDLTL